MMWEHEPQASVSTAFLTTSVFCFALLLFFYQVIETRF